MGLLFFARFVMIRNSIRFFDIDMEVQIYEQTSIGHYGGRNG